MSPRRRRRIVALAVLGALAGTIATVRSRAMDANEARFRARHDRPS